MRWWESDLLSIFYSLLFTQVFLYLSIWFIHSTIQAIYSTNPQLPGSKSWSLWATSTYIPSSWVEVPNTFFQAQFHNRQWPEWHNPHQDQSLKPPFRPRIEGGIAKPLNPHPSQWANMSHSPSWLAYAWCPAILIRGLLGVRRCQRLAMEGNMITETLGGKFELFWKCLYRWLWKEMVVDNFWRW
jgi:hypothetical protein